MAGNAVPVHLPGQSRMQRTERVHALQKDAPGWNSASQLSIVENHLKFSATLPEACSAQLCARLGG